MELAVDTPQQPGAVEVPADAVPPLEATGVERVDRALERLAESDAADLPDRVAALEAAHEGLRAALEDADLGPDAEPA